MGILSPIPMMDKGHPHHQPRAVHIDGIPVHPLVPDCAWLVEWAELERRRLKTGWKPKRYKWRPEDDDWVAQLHRNDELDLDVLIARRFRGSGAHEVVVAVPGTDSWFDWFNYNLNLHRTRVDDLPGRWHRGFMRAARWVWRQILEHVGPEDRLSLTGHSLGASTVLSVAAFAASLGVKVEAVIAFAPTRVCNRLGRDWLLFNYPAPRLQAFLHGADIVPRLIPGICGWRRVPLLYIGTDGVLRRRAKGELRKAVGQAGLQIISHHQMPLYREWAVRAVTDG